MPNIFLDCCQDDVAAAAIARWRETRGFNVLGTVENVNEINRLIVSIGSDGVPVDGSDKTYYPDDAVSITPPKIFVVSTG